MFKDNLFHLSVPKPKIMMERAQNVNLEEFILLLKIQITIILSWM
jgi:hypothetical protein